LWADRVREDLEALRVAVAHLDASAQGSLHTQPLAVPQHVVASILEDRTPWCLIGEKASGKTSFVSSFLPAGSTGYQVFHLYKDLSSRDIFQLRDTDAEGNSTYSDSPLTKALLTGGTVVLDGLHRLSPAALSSLRPVLHDPFFSLPDGRILISHAHSMSLSRSADSLTSSSSSTSSFHSPPVLPIPPSFRVIALAEPPSTTNKWLTAEALSMFSFQVLPSLSPHALSSVLSSRFPQIPPSSLLSLVTLYEKLPLWQQGEDTSSSPTNRLLTLRHFLRLAKRVSVSPDEMYQLIWNYTTAAHMPIALQTSFDLFLQNQCNIHPNACSLSYNNEEEILKDVQWTSKPATHPELIPKTVNYFPIESQLRIFKNVLTDWSMGEKFVMLIGPQGTGKVPRR
jgi:hypothetical protein